MFVLREVQQLPFSARTNSIPTCVPAASHNGRVLYVEQESLPLFLESVKIQSLNLLLLLILYIVEPSMFIGHSINQTPYI